MTWIKGDKIPFLSRPTQRVQPNERRWSADKKPIISDLLVELKEKGAIRKCRDNRSQYISDVFLVPKPNGRNRLILNLKNLNRFVSTNHFKLEDGRTVTRLLKQECFMAKVDLKDAYYLVPIHESCQKYLRFRINDTLFEFTCLPIGLNTAPYVFRKILKPVVAYLRRLGFHSVIYLDDLLLIGDSFSRCLENVKMTQGLLNRLGFIINRLKSQMRPKQRCCFLGFIYDSKQMSVELPEAKRLKIDNLLKNIREGQKTRIRKFAEIVEFLVACCPAVKYGWAYTKACERQKYLALKANNNNYEAHMNVSKEVMEEFRWWRSIGSRSEDSIRETRFELVIFTDASLTGWGAFCNGKRAQGHRKGDEKIRHINCLELIAALLGLKCFAESYRDSQILLRIDNTTAVSYINRMGAFSLKN